MGTMPPSSPGTASAPVHMATDDQRLAAIRAGRVLDSRTLDPATKMGALHRWVDAYEGRISDGARQLLKLRGVRLLTGEDTGLYDGHIPLPRSRLAAHLTSLAEAAVVRESRLAAAPLFGPCTVMGLGAEPISFAAVRDPDDLAEGLYTLLCMRPPSGRAATAFLTVGADLPLTALVATMLLPGVRLSREGTCTWRMIPPEQFERLCPLDGTPTMVALDGADKLCMLEYGGDAVQLLTWALTDHDWKQIVGAMYLVDGSRPPRPMGICDPRRFVARFARAFSNSYLHGQYVDTMGVLWGCTMLEQANPDGPLGTRQRSLQLLVEGRLREYNAPSTLRHNPWGERAEVSLAVLQERATHDPARGNWHNHLFRLVDECRAQFVRNKFPVVG